MRSGGGGNRWAMKTFANQIYETNKQSEDIADCAR